MRRRAPLLAGAVSAVLALLLLVFLLMPKMSEVEKKREELDQATQQSQQLETQVAALLDARDSAQHVKRQMERLARALPPTTQLPLLLNQLRAAADEAAVDFEQVGPGQPQVGPLGFSIVSLTLRVNGSYFSIDEYLFRLEHLGRAVKVSGLELSPGPNGLPQLTANITAEVYTTDLAAGPGAQTETATDPGTEEEGA